MNPSELNKLIEYVHQPSPDVSSKETDKVSVNEETKTQKPNHHKDLIQPDKVSLELSCREKLDPFTCIALN